MGPVAENETCGGSEPALCGEKLSSHEQCNQQIQRLKEHLIAMDLEATEEARQHKQEVDELMAQIAGLKAEIENQRGGDDAQLKGLERLQEENEHLKGLIGKMEEKSQRDSREIENLKSCLELSESRIEDDVRERTAGLQKEIKEKVVRVEHLEKLLRVQEEELEGQRLGNSIRAKLEADLDRSARLVDQLNEEINYLKAQLSNDGQRLATHGFIDRNLIANLFVSLQTVPPGDQVRRLEVLSLIANVLSLDEAQRQQIGIHQREALLDYKDPKLADMWAAFLVNSTR